METNPSSDSDPAVTGSSVLFIDGAGQPAAVYLESSRAWVRVVSTAANASDISQTAELLHGEETRVGADAGYVGATKREEVQKKLKAMPHEVRWHIAKRRKPIREMKECWQKKLALAFEKLKARIRARVEHPFHIVKNIFKHKKARYKGLKKNDAQLNVLFALSNLYMVRGKLCP